MHFWKCSCCEVPGPSLPHAASLSGCVAGTHAPAPPRSCCPCCALRTPPQLARAFPVGAQTLADEACCLPTLIHPDGLLTAAQGLHDAWLELNTIHVPNNTQFGTCRQLQLPQREKEWHTEQDRDMSVRVCR